MQKRLLLNTAAVLSLLLFAILAGLSYAQEPASPTAVAGTPLTATFTYQGQLMQGGQPVSATCSMIFRLFDAAAGGSQVGPPIPANITVTDGLFTTSLDFGAGLFDGNERWLDVAVQCPGDGAPVNLGRQALTAAPYALYALNAALLDGMGSSDFFKVGGNAVAADAVLGTTSNHGLEIRVNDQRVLTLLPSPASPNLVGGYSANTVSSGKDGAVIGGGGFNSNPNSVTDHYGTVSGGADNTSNYYATVSGGRSNTASYDYATVGGGRDNIADGYAATVGGGNRNTASGERATVSGGLNNIASGERATVAGGDYNTASGGSSMVAGGSGNNAEGHFSFAAGRRAKANAAGCFVWGDSTSAEINCNDANRTFFRSSGGYVIYTNGSMTSGAYILSGGGSWNGFSARAYKENFAPMDSLLLLQRLADIEISTWNYITQDAAIRHIGPMADDFNSLVDGLGGEGTDYINSLDADGVALAAIQGLYTIVQAQDAEIDGLKAEVDGLAARLAALETAQGDVERTSSGWESFLLLGAVLGGGFALYRRERGQP